MENLLKMSLGEIEICKECNGVGEVHTMESISYSEPHLQAPIGSETCVNCNGTGKESDEIQHERIIENLTKQQEEVLQEQCFKDLPMVLDDDMPDMYESWLENRSLEELKKILWKNYI